VLRRNANPTDLKTWVEVEVEVEVENATRTAVAVTVVPPKLTQATGPCLASPLSLASLQVEGAGGLVALGTLAFTVATALASLGPLPPPLSRPFYRYPIAIHPTVSSYAVYRPR
jgi:hypothetical protein